MKKAYPIAAVMIAAAVLLAAAPQARAQPRSVGYECRRVAATWAHVVTVDLNDRDVEVTLVLAHDDIGRAESFASMIHRTKPDAAITGTFFGVKGLLPIGNLTRDGRLLYPVATGTTLAITRDNRAVLLPTTAGKELDWTQYPTALFTGPRLLRAGKLAVAPWAEGFRDSGHYRAARRTAAGITAHNKLVLVAVTRPITLTRMASAMKDLGARDAVALDGGSSAALHFRAHTVIYPARSLTNIIAVYAMRRPGHILAVAPAAKG
jgi:hypothetical protein